jgi:hypothetical protein
MHVSTSPVDSYFPSTSAYIPTAFQTQNIDDIIYRYSSEQDCGTPTAGIYARDGIWDEDEVSEPRPPSSAASTSTRTQSSVKGRSRSGTVGSAMAKEDQGWSWSRRSRGPMPDIVSGVDYGVQEKTEYRLKEKKSMTKLRGKGRRGELSITVPSICSDPVCCEAIPC